ncbi:MAG: hypothetical protein U0704_11965 [Candidatus Eisenbacteria bacterium]
MSTESLGHVHGPSGGRYEVKWDPRGGDVYVSYAGWSRCGKADSASHAMHLAEAYLATKH